MRPFIFGLLALITACSPAGSPSSDLTGNMTLTDSSANWGTEHAPCGGEGYWFTIVEGAPIVVKDEEGTTIATGTLGEGRVRANSDQCYFLFTIPDVPDAESYSIEIGFFGPVHYSRDELNNLNWNLALAVSR
jgi:hypothetical protein